MKTKGVGVWFVKWMGVCHCVDISEGRVGICICRVDIFVWICGVWIYLRTKIGYSYAHKWIFLKGE